VINIIVEIINHSISVLKVKVTLRIKMNVMDIVIDISQEMRIENG